MDVFTRESSAVAVIGAGAVGLCCGLHLRRDGIPVDMFDHRDPGTGASLGNAGIIAACEVLPLARGAILRQVPRMVFDTGGPLVLRWRHLPRALPWFARFALASRPSRALSTSRHLAEMLKDSVGSWLRLSREYGFEDLLEVEGWLRLVRAGRTGMDNNGEAALQRELGIRVELVGSAEVADLEPALAPGAYAGAFYPDVGRLRSPLKVMERLAHEVNGAGGVIRRAGIRAIEPGADHVTLIDDDGGRHRYRQVVVAAGAWSRRLLRGAGTDVPLDTERGYHAMLPTPAATLRRPVTFVTPGFTLSQMIEGMRLTTGVEFAGLDAPADYTRLAHMVREARQVIPGLGETTAQWLGFRPSTPDSMPVIGRLKGNPRVVAAFGHGHLGVTLGPVTGRLVADILSDRPVADYAAALTPDRFARPLFS